MQQIFNDDYSYENDAGNLGQIHVRHYIGEPKTPHVILFTFLDRHLGPCPESVGVTLINDVLEQFNLREKSVEFLLWDRCNPFSDNREYHRCSRWRDDKWYPTTRAYIERTVGQISQPVNPFTSSAVWREEEAR